MNIEITKEDEAYIKEEIMQRYIDKRVILLLEKDDIEDDEFIEPLANRFKDLVDQGRYDKEIDKAFKVTIADDYISELFNFPDVRETIKKRFLKLFD